MIKYDYEWTQEIKPGYSIVWRMIGYSDGTEFKLFMREIL